MSIQVIKVGSITIVKIFIIPSNRPQVQHIEPTNIWAFLNTYTDLSPTATTTPATIYKKKTQIRYPLSPQPILPSIRPLNQQRVSFFETPEPKQKKT